jgi:hypothetical protein
MTANDGIALLGETHPMTLPTMMKGLAMGGGVTQPPLSCFCMEVPNAIYFTEGRPPV